MFKIYITSILVVILLVISGIFIYRIITNENKLSSEERTWINNNINNVQNVYVVKDENIFSKNDTSVFNSFLNDFANEYSITINPITFDGSVESGTINFNYTKNCECQ